MNKTIKFIYFLVFIAGCSKTIDENSLVERDSIKYRKGSSEPYSGEVITKYDSGQDYIIGNYQKGKESGVWTFLYKNGKKSQEGSFSEGNKSGGWNSWYENGIQKSKGKYINGDREGLWKYWYTEGAKEKEINFINGKENGISKGWYPDGKEKYLANYSIGKLNGDFLESDQNGNSISDGKYKNGEKWSGYFGDEHYINGVRGSLFTDFYKNGKKKIE